MIAGTTADCRYVLREKLVFMRAELIERLATKGIDGMLALLGSVGAAIEDVGPCVECMAGMAGHPEAVLRAAIRTPSGMVITPPKPLLAAANCPT